MNIRDVDRGLKRIRRELRNGYTQVGLPDGGKVAPATDSGSGLEIVDMAEMVMVGAANEFGTTLIPPRPYLRTATDESRTEIVRLQEKIISEIYQGRRTVKNGLSVLGEFLTGKVKNKIVAIKTPPNAPSTLARKYPKTNPLIDKGQLVQSIQHVEVVP